MLRPSSFRFVLALVFAAALVAPALGSAAPRSGEPVSKSLPTPAPVDVAARFWSFLSRLWNANGIELDPDGRLLPEAGTNSAACDNGIEVDPNGRCIG